MLLVQGLQVRPIAKKWGELEEMDLQSTRDDAVQH